MPTTPSVGDFIAAAMEQNASPSPKVVLKLQKKLREIEKIEAKIATGQNVDPLQREKVAKKNEIEMQIQELVDVASKPTSPIEQCTSVAVSTEAVVVDAAKKLRSISEDMQTPVCAITAADQSQSCATTVPGSDNSGASTPPQDTASERFASSTPSRETDQIICEEMIVSTVKPVSTRWSDDVIDDDALVYDKTVDPNCRNGSQAWHEQIKQRNSTTWRRVANNSRARRIDSYASKVFSCLDTDGDGVLSSSELRVFAQATGFDDENDAWDKLYEDVCMGVPDEGLTFNNFSHLFKGLMADDQFQSQIAEVYPESAMRQPRRAGGPRGNRPRFAKASTNPSLMTFEDVCATCTYEEVVRWCWQQGGYGALHFYLGTGNQGQNCSYHHAGMDAGNFG